MEWFGFARGGDHSPDGPRSRRNLPGTHAPVREPFYDRVEAPATPEQKALLAKLSPRQVKLTELAGEKIQTILTRAPGNDAPDRRIESGGRERMGSRRVLPGPRISTRFMRRASSERIICAAILEEAQRIVSDALAASPREPGIPSAPEPKEKM